MIEENNINQNLEVFSFPRLSGTNAERQASKLVLDKLKDFNLKPNIQEFTFSTYFGRIYPKLVFFLSFLLILMFYLNFKSFLFPIIYIIALLIILYHFILARKPENIKIGKNLNSRNIYVKLFPELSRRMLKFKESGNYNNSNNILFFCHLDSKSQKLSILARIRMFRSWVFSSIVLLIITILKNHILYQFFLIFYIIGAVPLSILLIATIFILINSTGNKSNGSIDNASGIVCVFELLKYYLNPKLRLRNFNLWFVFTGAEECGTMGIRNFLKILKDIDRNKAIFFNFDAIAKSVYLFPSKNKTNDIFFLNNLFFNNLKKLEIKKNPKKIYFGSHSDGYYLKKQGYQGFGMGDIESYKYIHSVNDTKDKIDTLVLKKLCEVIIGILKDYDTNFNRS